MSTHEEASPAAPAEGPIDPQTTMGAVSLTVADLETADAFYRRALGLHGLERSGGRVVLGAAPGAPLVELVGAPDAPPRPRRSTGLFHLAILVPDRAELARSLRRVLAAGAGFTGASDHLVSEALYLHDPEGNGIEIYRDRPREEWRREGGEIAMDTLPLDVEGVLGALPEGGDDEGVPRRVRARRWATCISRCATWTRPRTSTARRWASSPPRATTPGRSSSRRAATTTTSASTPGAPPGAAAPVRRAGAAGCPGGGAERRRAVARGRPPRGARYRLEQVGRGTTDHGSRRQPGARPGPRGRHHVAPGTGSCHEDRIPA